MRCLLRAQVTMFMIVGLVLIISAVGMLFLVASTQEATPSPAVEERSVNAQTCLERATRTTLEEVWDQGVITSDQGGPLPASEGPYVYLREETNDFVQGRRNYYGLCSRTGPNAPNAGRLACPSNTYTVTNPSIQDQLSYAITQRMHECLEEPSGFSEVVIQHDSIQVYHDQPRAQTNQPTLLTSTWAAIAEFLDGQTRNTTYAVQEKTLIGCSRCQAITVTRQPKEYINGEYYDRYNFSHQEQLITSILLEDRGIAQQTTSGIQKISTLQISASEEIYSAQQVTLYAFDNDTLVLQPAFVHPLIDLRLSRPQEGTRYELDIAPICVDDDSALDISIPVVSISDGYANTVETTPLRMRKVCTEISLRDCSEDLLPENSYDWDAEQVHVLVLFSEEDHLFPGSSTLPPLNKPVDVRINGVWYNFSTWEQNDPGWNVSYLDGARGHIVTLNEPLRDMEFRLSQINYSSLDRDGFGRFHYKILTLDPEVDLTQAAPNTRHDPSQTTTCDGVRSGILLGRGGWNVGNNNCDWPGEHFYKLSEGANFLNEDGQALFTLGTLQSRTGNIAIIVGGTGRIAGGFNCP